MEQKVPQYSGVEQDSPKFENNEGFICSLTSEYLAPGLVSCENKL